MADQYEFERQRDSARVTGALQPDQRRPNRPDVAEKEDDAVQLQGADLHRNPDGSVAFVDEARAVAQEQARLKSLRSPVVDPATRTVPTEAPDARAWDRPAFNRSGAPARRSFPISQPREWR